MNFKSLLKQSLLWRGFYFFTILMLNILLSRILQASGSGWVYYLCNIFSLLLLVGSLSMESAFTYFASSQKIEQQKLGWLAVSWSVLVTILLGIVMFFYTDVLKKGEVSSQRIIIYGVLYIGGTLLVNFYTVLFYAAKNFLLPNIIMGCWNIAIILLLFVLYKSGYSIATLLNVYFSLLPIQGIHLFLAYTVQNKSWTILQLPSAKEIQYLLKYAMVALGANLLFFLVYRIDYWFVRHSPAASADDLGNYLQVSRMGQMLLIIPQIIASAVFPQTASGEDRISVHRSILLISRLMTLLYIVIIAVTALTGNMLFPFVFGASFDSMYLPMLIILPGILALSMLTLLSAYFSGKNLVRINMIGAAFALVVVAACNALFTPKYGVVAAAIINTAGYFVNLLYAILRFRRDYGMGVFSFFFIRKADIVLLKQLLFKKAVP